VQNVSVTADKLELRGSPQSEAIKAPRPGMKIAVVRTRVNTSLLARDVQWVRPGEIFVDNVYVDGNVSVTPLFSVIRNPWEITPEDDRTKQTAVDFVSQVDLALLPQDQRVMLETFRQERAQKVNYTLRTYNIEKAEAAEEVGTAFAFAFPDAQQFLLTPKFKQSRSAE
jgi:hypothetical protein